MTICMRVCKSIKLGPIRLIVLLLVWEYNLHLKQTIESVSALCFFSASKVDRVQSPYSCK